MQLPNAPLVIVVTFHDMTERKRYEQEITFKLELNSRSEYEKRTFELEALILPACVMQIEEHKGTPA